MKKYILQHCTIEQHDILAISKPYNEAYAKKHGFEYSVSDMSRRCPNKPLNYEKIGYLKEILPKLEENSLVVWLDADTICLDTNESFEKALPPGEIIGMVRMLHGVGCKEPHNWWNIGVTVMKNVPSVRSFIDNIHERNDENDEMAMMRQLKEQCYIVGDGKGIFSLDYKWNCWGNNSHVCKKPCVVSFHGIKTSLKMDAIKKWQSGRKD